MYSTGYSTKSRLTADDVARAYTRTRIGKDGKLKVYLHRGATMTVECTGSSTKSKVISTLAPIGNDVNFGCHLINIETSTRALLERVFFVQHGNNFVITPEPDAGAFFTDALVRFRQKICETVGPRTPITMHEYASSFKGKKLKIYSAAVESLVAQPLEQKDSHLNSFVKCEKINRTAKFDPAPRIIQPRKPRYNVALGRYIKPIEHAIYRAIDKLFGSPTVVKGMNGAERGNLLYRKWQRFRNPVAIGIDAKRFDQHVSEDALKYEHSFYRRIYHGDLELKKLLGWQMLNVGYVNTEDGTIKYTIRGGRCSGDVTTSLGNVIIMCGMIYDYMAHTAVDSEVADDGDDAIIIVEKEDLHRLDGLADYFLRYGFEMERDEPVYELEHIKFCQCQPVNVGGEYRMVRDPRVAVAKDLCVTRHFLHERDWNSHRMAISMCGEALAGDVPIYTEFYQCLRRGTPTNRRGRHGLYKTALFLTDEYNGLMHASRGMSSKFQEPLQETRYSFWLAFGITPDEQVVIENYYKSIPLTWETKQECLQFPVDTACRW